MLDHKSMVPRWSQIMLGILVMMMVSVNAQGDNDIIEGLEGVGYREQELQVAKSQNFLSEEPKGLSWVSFAGGTHIFIKGFEFGENANALTITLTTTGLTSGATNVFTAPPLTEEDVFNSQPLLGSISYRLPSLKTLTGVDLYHYSTLTFELKVVGNGQTLICATTSNCNVKYMRDYTPQVKKLNPSVFYQEAMVEWIVDPRRSHDLETNLLSDEMPFINAKTNGSQHDFEFQVDNSFSFTDNTRNYFRGQVGKQTVTVDGHVSMTWSTGYSDINKVESQTCPYNMTGCYSAKYVPAIFSTNATEGYVTGGNTLQIKGSGFKAGMASPNVSVEVDSLACAITKLADDAIECTLKESAAVSNLTNPYIGQYGIRRSFVNKTTTPSYSDIWLDTTPQHLATAFSGWLNFENYYGNGFKGWYLAPETTEYRFHMQCDDLCKFELSTVPNDVTNNVTTLLSHTSWKSKDDYWRPTHSYKPSVWVNLTKGEHYYMRGQHIEGSGGDHYNVAVELKKTNSTPANHHHDSPEIQYLSITPTEKKWETMDLKIDIAAGQTLNGDKYNILIPYSYNNSIQSFAVKDVLANTTAATLKSQLRDYFKGIKGYGDSQWRVTRETFKQCSDISYAPPKTCNNFTQAATPQYCEQVNCTTNATTNVTTCDLSCNSTCTDKRLVANTTDNCTNSVLHNNNTFATSRNTFTINNTTIKVEGTDLVINGTRISVKNATGPKRYEIDNTTIVYKEASNYTINGTDVFINTTNTSLIVNGTLQNGTEWIANGTNVTVSGDHVYINDSAVFINTTHVEFGGANLAEDNTNQTTNGSKIVFNYTTLKVIVNSATNTTWINLNGTKVTFTKDNITDHTLNETTNTTVNTTYSLNTEGCNPPSFVSEADDKCILYKIEILRLHTGTSYENTVTLAGAFINDKKYLPTWTKVQESSTPLGGRMRVKCIYASGQVAYTSNFQPYQVNWNNYVAQKIEYDCPNMWNKVQSVKDTTNFVHHSVGVAAWIRFRGYKGEISQFEFVDGDPTPISPSNTTQNNSIYAVKGATLFYEPIPFEQMKTYETKPQVMVTVNNMPAVCKNLTCDYSYVDAVGQIDTFTYTSANKTLYVTGTKLPLLTNVTKVTYAQGNCAINASTVVEYNETSTNATDNSTINTPFVSSFECILNQTETCGTWHPLIVSRSGLIPLASGVSQQQIDCTATAASVAGSTLNVLGGDNLIINGTMMPHNLHANTFNITLTDSNSKSFGCTPLHSQTDYIKCNTQELDKTNNLGQTLTLTITINGLAVTSSLTLTVNANNYDVVQIIPKSRSPVLKRNLTIELNSNFPYTLSDRADFTVNVTNKNDSNMVKNLNVIAVFDANKTVVVKFGGAYSGNYSMQIHHKTYGLLDASNINFEVGSNVTAISTNTGSIHGGTLITITGTNFGDEITDNPVQISYNGALGSTHCYVQTTSETQITCRVQSMLNATTPLTQEVGKEGKIIVFLKVSEEAVCTTNCNFTFTDTSLPTITSATTVLNTTTNLYNMVLTGTNFGTDMAGVKLFLDNPAVQQTTIQAEATTVKFQIDNSSSYQLLNKAVYFTMGKPAGHNLIDSLTLTPSFISLTPATGYYGTSEIMANIQGVGISDKAAVTNFFDSSAAEICQNVTVLQYGTVLCHTKPQNISSEIGIKVNGTTYNCPGSSPCPYNQTQNDSAMPITTDYTIDTAANTITFTGTYTGFQTSDSYDAVVSFMGSNFSSTSTYTTTSVVAVFDKGVPLTDSFGGKPILRFVKTTNGVKLFHQTENPGHKLYNLPTYTTALDTTSSCSFAGGCRLSFNVAGLSTTLAYKNSTNQSPNRIEVCGEECVYSASESTSTIAKCILPRISTNYSNTNFGIKESSENLKPKQYFGNFVNYTWLFDGNLLKNPKPTAANSFAGFDFGEGYVGLLSQIKFFMGQYSSKTTYEGKLSFEGSNDNSTYTNIFTANSSLNEGWNYHTYSNAADYPGYRYYRFFGSGSGSCNFIQEVQLTGVKSIMDNNPNKDCNVDLFINETKEGVFQPNKTQQFINTATPMLSEISPRYGSVVGGYDITFIGTTFSSDHNLYTITIDGVDCPATAANTTSVTCTAAKRPGLPATTLQIYISGIGYVSTQGLTFLYVNLWSSDTTWGGEFQPMDGESVYVPSGLNLMVDIDESPMLNLVMVEGTIIFPSNDTNTDHHRKFHARYIFITNGTMEVGTEKYPYQSQITFTMYGNLSSPYLPIYGNKCVGVRYGTLDMHGVERNPTWTVMNHTAKAGDTSITLARAVDWKVGEEIAIASTNYDGRKTDKRTIKSITRTDPEKPVITFEEALDFDHFAEVQKFGDEYLDTRAEVGLLTRNIKYRGDPADSAETQYGGIFFIHSEGDDSVVARFSYIELNEVGQAFKVGRYAIHFHMIGAVHKSYAKGLATHTSFNRAFTIHGTHYLRLQDNVGYNIMGHNVFIEDAVETKNLITGNLMMQCIRSWSLLNTDTTPACFWITHPDNSFLNNHAAGSDRYGYWYDLQTSAIGPSAPLKGCPHFDRVGEFRNNTSHSCGRYGLRIFHNMVPKQNQCGAVVYDPNHAEGQDPFHQNPAITANFYNLTSWKNGRNGAIAERVGDVRFYDFKVSDNILAGIEFSLTSEYGDNTTQINNCLIIGRSNAGDNGVNGVGNPRGIITPRTENFLVQNSRFYNYDFGLAAALGSCSHCFHPAATDSGARTVTFNNLTFTNVTKRIRYQFPFRAIYHDIDGSLTDQGPNSYATWQFSHLVWPNECFMNATMFDGVVCNNNTQIRRIQLHKQVNSNELYFQTMMVLQWENAEGKPVFTEEEKQTKMSNFSLHGQVDFRDKTCSGGCWPVPLATGHTYKFSFGKTGVNFESMRISMSERWKPWDKHIHLVHNFSDVRAGIEVYNQSNKIEYINDTIPEIGIANTSNTSTLAAAPYKTGMNLILNDTDNNTRTMEMHLILTGPEKETFYSERHIDLKGVRCYGTCFTEEVQNETTPENVTRKWSQLNSWKKDPTNSSEPDPKIPVAGDNVVIPNGWVMYYDLNDSGVFKSIEIQGQLIFDPNTTQNLHLRTREILIRHPGLFQIGTKEKPFEKEAKITLHGKKNDEALAFINEVEGGNKIIANVGQMHLYGKRRTKDHTRLHAEAKKGDTQITVEPGLDLVAGDRIAILTTSFWPDANDDKVVVSYDNTTGVVVLDSALMYYHWGRATDTISKYQYDIRAEVLILSRNIKIVGEDVESWGCQIVTGKAIETDWITIIYGETIMDSVEVYNCSQWDTEKAAIRFQTAVNRGHSVTHCSFHNGLGIGMKIMDSNNITFSNNVMFGFRPFGVLILPTVNDLTFNGNIISQILWRPTFPETAIDRWAGFSLCSLKTGSCNRVKVTNNIVAGAMWAGFIAYGEPCGTTQANSNFYGNVAHSTKRNENGGHGILLQVPPGGVGTCMELKNAFAYKNYMTGASLGANPGPDEVRMSNLVMLDNQKGVAGTVSSSSRNAKFILRNSKIYGQSDLLDCPPNAGFVCLEVGRAGLTVLSVGTSDKSFHPDMEVQFPYHKTEDANWFGRVEYVENEFIDFVTPKTTAGGDFTINIFANPDYSQPAHFIRNTFTNVHPDNFVFIAHPPQKWANLKDCGNFPCTGPLNVLYHFYENTWTHNSLPQEQGNFQVIANNTEFAPFISGCVPKVKWNAYLCRDPNLGVLLFESNDADKMDRAMQPIYVDGITVQGATSSINNKLNAFMDHVWDGFYTGQVRLSRFPSIIRAQQGDVYELKYTGSPAKNQSFALRANIQNAAEPFKTGLTVRIPYPSAESRSILKQGVEIEYNQWDESIRNYGEIKGTKCGENRYIGVKNILEFYITAEPDCEILIIPRDAIQTLVRMEWTFDEFFSNGGTTTFIDRVAGSLGIHASTIKIVSVYEGSLVVNYEIRNDDPVALASIKETQTQKFATGGMSLGAPILDVETDSSSVVADGVVTAAGYPAWIVTKTSTNSAVDPASWALITLNDTTLVTQEQIDEYFQEQREFNFDHVPIVIEDGTTKIVNPAISGDDEGDDVEEEQDKTENNPANPGDILKDKNKSINLAILVSFMVLAVVLLALLLRAIINYFKHKNATHLSQANKKSIDDLTKEEGIAMTVTVGKGDELNAMRQTQLAKEGMNPFEQQQFDYRPDYAQLTMSNYTSSRGFSRPSGSQHGGLSAINESQAASNIKLKEVEEEIVDVAELGPGQ